MSRKSFKKRIRNKRYYFSDKSIASDTVIAFALGGIAIVAEIAGIAASVVTKGKISEFFGMLYVCAFLLGLCGICFSRFARKAQEGSLGSKQWSLVVCIISVLIPVIFTIYGLIN